MARGGVEDATLTTSVADRVDPLLFTYMARGGVEDATLTTSVADRVDPVLFTYMARGGVEDATLTTSVADRVDPLLFTYMARGGVEDATLTLVHLVASHLDKAGSVLFMDMSAAFQTIQHHVLIQRFLDLDVHFVLVLWIRQFLCDRPQRVSLNAHMLVKPVLSDEMVVNTGAPQGCFLSPVLFSLCTNDIRYHDPVLILLKYADYMAFVGCLKDEFSISQYFLD